MPGSPPAGPFVFQLRVVLRGVSPLIWRRLLVRSDSSIADLHATLQFALGWSDQHLNGVAQGAFSYTLNAGKTKTDGVEFNVNYLVTRGLTLNGAVSYNHARLAEDLPQAATDSGNGGNSGDPIPLSPKWVAAAGGNYEFPINNRFKGYATANANFRDHTQIGFNSTNLFYAELPSYTLVDVKFGVRWDHFDVGAFVRNIADKAAVAGLFKSVDATRVYSPYPRMIGLAASWGLAAW